MATTYKIKPGDNLTNIAKQLGTTVDALLKANPNIKNPNIIQTGANLNVPSSGSGITEVDFSSDGKTITGTKQNATLPTSPATHPIYGGAGSVPATPLNTGKVAPSTGSTPSPVVKSSTQTNQNQQTQQTQQNQSTTKSTTGGGSAGAGGGSQTNDGSTPISNVTPTPNSGLTYDPAMEKYGVTQDLWNKMNATQQMSVEIAFNVAKTNYAANASALTVQDALAAAAKDPNIVAKYSNAFGLDKKQITQAITQIQTATSLQSTNQKEQFGNERTALAELMANSGTAYSGWRGKAQTALQTSEEGIVTSSRAAVQKQLDEATAAFEAKYGSTAAMNNPAIASFINPLNQIGKSISGLNVNVPGGSESLSGGILGGVKGSNVIAQEQDINALAAQNVALAKPVPITPITA